MVKRSEVSQSRHGEYYWLVSQMKSLRRINNVENAAWKLK